MGICMWLSIPVAAGRTQTSISPDTQQSTIQATVPDFHTITIRSEHAGVIYQDEEADDEDVQETVTYAVDRFSSPQFQIQAHKGWKIIAVLLNGEDVTDQLVNGMLTIPEIYENQQLVVETEESQEDDNDGDDQREEIKPTGTKDNNGSSTGSSPGGKTGSSAGGGQKTQTNPAGTANGTAAVKTADQQIQVTYLVAAAASGMVILILLDNRKKRRH